MNKDSKRELLAQVLAGQMSGLRAYQQRNQADDPTIRVVLDSRPAGGSIIVVYHDNTQKEVLPEELDALPPAVHKRCVVFQDYST